MPSRSDDPANPLRGAAAWAPLDTAVVLATGRDAVRFVDNFATAALSPLEAGQGTEAFFADARGWVLALTTILRTAGGLAILAAPGAGPRLRDHLDRYHIREALELTDASAQVATLLVAGPEARDWLVRLGVEALPQVAAEHIDAELDGGSVRIVRVEGQGADGFWLQAEPPVADRIAARLQAAGLPRAEPPDIEAMRIEACFPAPHDMPEKTLPQELGRDARAISFTKGCYLGQETVARLDALGHVNRRLVLVTLDTPQAPTTPVAVSHAGERVGTITSACLSPRRGRPVGLGLMQTRAITLAGLQVEGSAATVAGIAGTGDMA